MEKNGRGLCEQEVFIREFIACYKQHPMLWDQNHAQYRNRTERTLAYDNILKKCREYHPEVDQDYVKMKIESMRSSFRKERKKVVSSREDNPEDLYKPSLWYYDLLLFTVGEEAVNPLDSVDNSEQVTHVRVPYWSREDSAMLINFYKHHPCLYAGTHPHYKSKRKRNDALKKVTEQLISATGKYFYAEDVRKKISLIRGQFLFEYKKVKKNESTGESYKPTLWCYEMLSFLKENYSSRTLASPPTQNGSKNDQKSSSSDDSDDNLEIKKESDSSLSHESVHLDTKQSVEDYDIFDTIAKNLAHKMREMDEGQREIAIRIVRDVMYHGQMEHLTLKSRLSLDGS